MLLLEKLIVVPRDVVCNSDAEVDDLAAKRPDRRDREALLRAGDRMDGVENSLDPCGDGNHGSVGGLRFNFIIIIIIIILFFVFFFFQRNGEVRVSTSERLQYRAIADFE